MKKIFTLAAILFSITSFAAERPKPAKLAVTSNGRDVLMVKIDGVVHTLDRNTFVMDNIRAGNHNITIYKSDLVGFRKKTTVLYNSSLYISPSQFIDIDVNRNGKVKVNKTQLNNYGRDNRDDRWDGNGRNNNDRNYDERDGRSGRF